MIDIDTLKQMALSFADTSEAPHFDRIAFKAGKKIFATYDAKTHTANIKLSIKEQDVFCCYDKAIIYPVSNKWGLQGWTTIELKTVKKKMLADALKTAYDAVKK